MWMRIVAVAALLVVGACSDRTPVTPGTDAPLAVPPVGPSARRPDALARQFAKTLKNPAFRAYLKAQLDASPYVEHKLQFQTFLGANGGRALREIAAENSETKDAVSEAAKQAIALEVYFPVPAHRSAWTGDENVLVATALTDREAPVAFDPRGGATGQSSIRTLLRPHRCSRSFQSRPISPCRRRGRLASTVAAAVAVGARSIRRRLPLPAST
jgi:hypothetical protein